MIKSGDYVACGWEQNGKECQWVAIFDKYFDGDIDCEWDWHHTLALLYTKGELEGKLDLDNGICDSQQWIRHATEDEKRLLDNALARDGYYFDEYDLELKDVYNKCSDTELADIIARCSNLLNNRLKKRNKN